RCRSWTRRSRPSTSCPIRASARSSRRSPTGRRSRSCSWAASCSAGATSSRRCTSRGSSPRRCCSVPRRMPPVAVATDSTHYLPRGLADPAGIHQVSLHVGWKGAPERELEMGGFDAFYERLGADSELPSTSQPSIGDFLSVWEPLIDDGRDVVSIHLAGGISGTCEAARQAHGLLVERGLGDRVEVIDGETACGGLGLLLLAACAAARAGVDKDAVAAHVREARKALRIWFCLDTLEYLRRGGRIGKAQAWLGGTLKIKPILSLEFEIVPVERVRTAGRAFERMGDHARALHDNGSDAWVVQHIQATEQAERLIERCREIFDSEPVFTSEVGPVIGTYTGPGLIGVGGAPRSFLAGGGFRASALVGVRPLAERRWPARSAPATAAQHARADEQADDRGADRELAAMALDVPAPVGEVGHLSAQAVDRDGELHAVALDRIADLGGRALCHQVGIPSLGPSASVPELTVSRILRASSIAISGTGGDPFLTALAAIRPAIAPRITRITAIAKKPQK